MELTIGDTAPDFEAQTTEGRIHFHEWIGDSWAVLFSHPKDFTPVCTTELGYMAKLKPEFDKRRTKIIGLSVDPVENHTRWSNDIKETQGFAPNYPMIGVADHRVVRREPLRFLDVVRPARVIFDWIDAQADDLGAPLVELRLELGHVAELGRAD